MILASASPRRRELLEAAGWRFEVRVPRVDETLLGLGVEETARTLALRKAAAVAGECAGERAWVLGADTLVALGEGAEVLLGKPASCEEARRMLGSLSGRRQRVVSGVAVVRLPDGASWTDCEGTDVWMRRILPAELEAYVASGEWRDKAGGYAIQETADRFVTRLEGRFDNVVGLPLPLARRLLERAGAPAELLGGQG